MNVENVVEFTVNAARCVTQNINVYPDTIDRMRAKQATKYLLQENSH